MSMEVLTAILGREKMAKMSPDEIKKLAHELDAEILKDPELADRLGRVIKEAASKLHA